MSANNRGCAHLLRLRPAGLALRVVDRRSDPFSLNRFRSGSEARSSGQARRKDCAGGKGITCG